MREKNDFRPEYLILSFSIEKWGDHWGMTSKMTSELSKGNKVIYVTPRRELRGILKETFRIKTWTGWLKFVNPNLLLIDSPPFFPKIYKTPLIDKLIERMYHLFLALVCFIFAGKRKKLIYLWNPEYSDFISWYKKEITIFHAYDNYALYTFSSEQSAGDNMRHQEEIATFYENKERQLITNTTLFYAVSDVLCNYYENKYHRRPKLLPNAVDCIYFRDDGNDTHKKQAKKLLKDIEGYKIGYSGSIKGSLDLDIIIESARELKEFSFIFIGKKIYTNIKEYDDKLDLLLSCDNVYHLGHQDLVLLPWLLGEMDILLMAYSNRKDVWTYYGDPAKLFEYMAIGKPIISTPHPVVDRYKEVISVVKDPYEMISAARNSIASQRTENNSKHQTELARKNTWGHRVSAILNDVRKLDKSDVASGNSLTKIY